MKRIILLFLLCITCACIDAGAQATSAADRLYARGVTYMKTMTISMQKKAIAAFGKAKVAYDSKAKKNLCDEQIAACRNIIRKLSAANKRRNRRSKAENKIAETKTDTAAVVPDSAATADITPAIAEISVAPTLAEFSIDGGKYVEITVTCNFDDWKVKSCPDWITYTAANNKLLVKAKKNKEKAERAGIIVVECRGTEAEVIVKQEKGGFFKRLF